MKVYVYCPASRVVQTGELAALPAPGDVFCIGGVELIAESVRGEATLPGNVRAVKVFARPTTCAECGVRIGSRAFHVRQEGRVARRSLCGPCCLFQYPGEHAAQSVSHERANLPHNDPMTIAIFG